MSDTEPEGAARARTVPRWLPVATAVLAGFQIFSWLAAILAVVGVALLVPILPRIESRGLEMLVMGLVAALGLAASVGVAAMVGMRLRARLARASFAAVVIWAVVLALLTFVGPAPFVYTVVE